jgi:hypothetical protein
MHERGVTNCNAVPTHYHECARSGCGQIPPAIVPGRKMLSLPTKSFRVKAAVAVAALYAFCILLPALAFTLADGRMAPPCLIDDLAAIPVHSSAAHHHGGAPDAHAEAATHHHAGQPEGAKASGDSDGEKSRPGECCGLFPMVALAGVLRPAPVPSRLTSTVIPVLADALIGRGPDRIIRPPIA